MSDYCDATDGYMEDISKALATTASIFNYTYPNGSANDIIEEHSIISQKITKLENDLVNHEGEINKEIVNNTDTLINQIAVVNGTIGVNWKKLKGYKEGDDKKNRELCKLVSNAEKFDAEKTVDQAIITSSESDFDINELGKSVLDYLLKSLNQITLGNFTEYVTLLGTIGQILLGIFDVDILCDIRDLIADFDKLGTDEKVPIWQWGLDIIALLPVIGAVKYTDEAAVLFKQADKIGNSEKYIDELDELIKHADEFSDVGKNADEAGEVSKYADELDDAGKGGKGGNDKGGSIKKSGKYSTQISPEMEKKILEGQRKSPVKNEVIGGHSPQINNSNDLFAVEELSVNADGTRNIKFVKDLQDGSISKIKKSTVFPDSWSDSKIIDTIKEVGDSPSISVRGRDGATWHRKIVDGVEVDVIKLGNDVISGYPTGKINAPKPSGF